MDAPAIYAGARRRIIDLARTLSPEELSTTVPACPEWTVQDTVAHLTGVAVDVQAGLVEGAATDEWTARQVEERRGRDCQDLLAEWEEAAPGFETLLGQVPAMWVTAMDVVTHEADIRGAVDRPRALGEDELDQVVQRFVSVIGRRLEKEGAPALRICAGVDEWIIGHGEPLATLRTEPYELFRTGFGRRSQRQIRAYDWDGDPAPYLPYLSIFPFPNQDLTEP